MDKFLETVERIWENDLIRSLVYLVIAFAAAFIASFITKKLFGAFKLDRWKGGTAGHSSAKKFTSKLVFLIVFLLFLPSILNPLGIDGISEPITNLVGDFLGYLPNLVAAAIIIFLGIFIGGILSDVIAKILEKTKIDSVGVLFKKKSSTGSLESETNQSSPTLSSLIGKIVYALILLFVIAEALLILNIEAVSEPVISIIDAIFGAVPKIALAALVIAIGVVVSGIAADLIKSLLNGFGLDGAITKAMPKIKPTFSVTSTISSLIRVLILLFVAAEGARILSLTVIEEFLTMLVDYIPTVIGALLIAALAGIGASLVGSLLGKEKSSPITKTIRAIIYVTASFMILSHLGFATTIVNFGFIISLSALAVAFAISFGIGGKDFAKKTLDKFNKGNSDKNQDN